MKRLAFAMARGAFTMAEILLSLTIIGVVAAITLPSLTGNINERTWNTQRKALYARLSQGFALLDSINTHGNSETFVTAALSKVLKINNVCDKDHLSDCGIVSSINNMAGTNLPTPTTLGELNSNMISANRYGEGGVVLDTFTQDDIDAAAFETQNGESIILYYNPKCQYNMEDGQGVSYFGQTKLCVIMLYDLNGNKGPNTVGKDIGIASVFYPSDSLVVAPVPANSDLAAAAYPYSEAVKACRTLGEEYRLPSREEMFTMAVNYELLGLNNAVYKTSTKTYVVNGGNDGNVTGTVNWVMNARDLAVGWHGLNSTYSSYIRCIKR